MTLHAGDRVVRGACPHDCPDTCAFLYDVKNGKLVDVTGDPDHPMTRGGLCVKLNGFAEHHYNPDRLLYPMRRTGAKGSGLFERISWSDALAEIKSRWTDIIAAYGAQAIMPHVYLGHQGTLNGLTAGDAFFNHLGSTVAEKTYCESGSSTAWIMTVGPSGGLDLESLAYAKYIIVWGMNMISTNLHAWPFILEAQKKGAKIVVIDPVRTRTVKQADWHVVIKPGTDGALALGMMNVIIGEGLVDYDYVEKYTLGFEELKVRAAGYPPERVAQITGTRGRHSEASARICDDAASRHSPGRGDREEPRRRAGHPRDHLSSGAGRRVEARGRRDRGNADLGIPDPFRPDLPAGLHQAGHARHQRARARLRAEWRDGARPADQVVVRIQFEPGVAGAGAGEARAGAAARGPVHGGQRALRHRYRALRRHSAAGDDAGRAVRPHGDLGSSLHDAQPAPYESLEFNPDLAKRYPLSIVSPKPHAFLNTQYGNEERQRVRQGEQKVLMHPTDAQARAIRSGSVVRVFNDRGSFEGLAELSEDLMPGLVMANVGYWPSLNRSGTSVNSISSDKHCTFGQAGSYSDNLVEVAIAPG